MEDLHRLADKCQRTSEHLSQVIAGMDIDDPDHNAVQIALSEAKRVRRDGTVLVKALAQIRDKLQPKEAQAKDE